MISTANISKITPPRLPNILNRPRLLNLLEKNRDKKLILILGQAAQGKTTLVASHVKTSEKPSAWINLDKSESDPVNLFYLITQSLRYVLKDIDFSPLAYESDGMMGSTSATSLYRILADFISQNVQTPVEIVFDGLDRLFQDSLSFQCIQIFLEKLPPHARLIMLSREIPPLSFGFQHLKVRQEALILTNEELSFTRDEIKEFFRKVKDLPLDRDQLEKIYAATEGWVGGLVLLSESLRSSDPSKIGYIIQDLPDHFHREVFQYFGKEIFSSQPKEVQQFLLKSSMMDIIEPALMKELIKTDNAEEILRDHARKNLFVHSYYDEKKGWLFRYQPMFRNFLKAKCLSEFSAEERASLNVRAGIHYEQRGDLEEATRYFLEAKAYPQAISVIERLGIDLLKKGRKGDLASWIYTLPEEMVQENPWLLFYLTMAKEFVAEEENVVSLKKAYDLFRKTGNVKGELRCLAQLLTVSMRAGIHPAPTHELIESGEALLESPEAREYRYESATLWYSMSSAYFLGQGDIQKGIWCCENAYLIAREIKDIPLQARALTYSALGLIYAGEFRLAEETCKKVETMIEKSVLLKELEVINLMVNCLLSNYRGDFEKTRRLVKTLQIEIEKFGFVSIYPWIYEISGYLRLMQGDSIGAEEVANRYLSTTRSMKNAFLKGLGLRLFGLIYLYRKDFKGARESIDQAIDALSKEAPSRYLLNRVKIISGLICYEMKEVERGEKELHEALEYFSSILSYNALVECHFALAFLKWDRGKKDEAALHLQKGFKIAADKKYEHFYSLGTIYTIKACLLALTLKMGGATDYIVQLLTRHLSSATDEELKKLSNYPDFSVREKIWEIQRKLYRSKVSPLRIETFGGFRVFRGDFPIEEEKWDRSQPKYLFKAIVSRGAQRVPKEVLMDDLWPDERPGAAEKDFKTALQRLRNSLEVSVHREFGSSYIHLHDNLVSLDQELSQVDVEMFLSLLKKGEEEERGGNTKAALSHYTEAMEIYKGDFLPEELYAPWADKKREELREKYIGLLNKAANLHDRHGALKKAIECYKKVIQADSLLEESYQKLMLLYSAKRMFNEALRTYEDCKKALKKELKSRPDETTDAIYKKIMEKITTSRPRARKSLKVGRIREAKA
jgi:ATP/maltotriose-dependent transcriptional regulator MalT/two-component SAPR family response regulator